MVKMSEIVRTMSERMPWPVAQRILSEIDLPRGHGWEKTIAALSDETADFSAKLESASAALVEHHLCGEKLVRMYKVSPEAKTDIQKKLQRLKLQDSDFKTAYPVYLSADKLEDAPNTPVLIAVEHTDHGTGVVFSSARLVTTREVLDLTDLKDGLYEEYEEVYGLKHIRHQAMDVVWIPANGNYFDIRIDFPHGMHRDVGEAAQAYIKAQFLTLISDDGNLNAPVNLHPLINKIYRAAKEGIVVELAFGTTTASTKHEKMRRKAKCLREETYHKGGKAALTTPIEPYRLSVIWKLLIGTNKYSTPELSLNSSARISADAQAVMFDAVIRNCMGYEDFDHVKARMEHFLPK